MNLLVLPWVAQRWRWPVMLLWALVCRPVSAWAWGDEGHAIIALIAEHYLQPPVRAQVDTLLIGDHSGLSADTSIAGEASWADRYRDADRDTTRVHYLQTRAWHYVDIELDHPDLRLERAGVRLALVLNQALH